MMTFPSHISNIFRIIICVALGWEILYLINPELRISDRIYLVLLKLAVCFAVAISYINDKEKMLAISRKGLLIEEIAIDPNTKKEKLSFIYILIGVVYNPLIPLFYSNTVWAITNGLTILFLVYKIDKRKK